jgi:hypothetical protein
MTTLDWIVLAAMLAVVVGLAGLLAWTGRGADPTVPAAPPVRIRIHDHGVLDLDERIRRVVDARLDERAAEAARRKRKAIESDIEGMKGRNRA